MLEQLTTHQAEDDPRNAEILIYVDGTLKPRSEATDVKSLPGMALPVL